MWRQVPLDHDIFYNRTSLEVFKVKIFLNFIIYTQTKL